MYIILTCLIYIYAKIITSISRSRLLIVYENIKIHNYNCLHCVCKSVCMLIIVTCYYPFGLHRSLFYVY